MTESLFLPLSPRQLRVLEAISDYVAKKRYPPTIPEIQQDLGLVNPGMVFKALSALEDKGYIVRTKSKHRSIRLTDVGSEFLNSSRQLALLD